MPNNPEEILEMPKDRYNWCKVFSMGKGKSILEDKNRLRMSYISMMIRRVNKMFEWKNLPETVIERELERQLQVFGYCAFTYVEVPEDLQKLGTKSGYYTLFGGVGGRYSAYYLPTVITVSNPYLRFSKMLKIDEDCVLIQNDMNYEGLMPIMDRYASMLAEIDLTIRMLSINSRYLTVLYAENDDVKLSLEDFVKKLLEGVEVGYITAHKIAHVDDETPQQFDTKQFTASGAGELIKSFIELKQYILGSWYCDLGIQATFNMKREALSESEIDLGDDTLLPLIDEMLEMRKMACEKINAKYGLNVSVDLSSAWKERKEENELKKKRLENEAESTEEQNEEKPEDKKEGEDNE